MSRNDCTEIPLKENNQCKYPRDKQCNAAENVRLFRYSKKDEIDRMFHLDDTYNVPDDKGRVLISEYCTAYRVH